MFDAAAGCRCCVRLGAWVLVLLQGATACRCGCYCVAWELGCCCCCRVPLLCVLGSLGACAVPLLCALGGVPLQCAAGAARALLHVFVIGGLCWRNFEKRPKSFVCHAPSHVLDGGNSRSFQAPGNTSSSAGRTPRFSGHLFFQWC